jgi:hypothetical protein
VVIVGYFDRSDGIALKKGVFCAVVGKSGKNPLIFFEGKKRGRN